MLIPARTLFGQGWALQNKGQINNVGTIKVKGGQVKGLPDTVGGRFEFLEDYPNSTQEIPNVTYNQLVIRNKGRKFIDTLKDNDGLIMPARVLDSLIVSDSVPLHVSRQGILAYASVTNQNATVIGKHDVRLLNESVSQEIQGNGRFYNLNIDNPIGVDIINGGGFRIKDKLELTRGQLYNSTLNNFVMEDSAYIVRHVEGSLQNSPQIEKSISVRYTGDGSINSGPELTDSPLYNLIVENDGNLVVLSDVAVNDSLYVGSPIHTLENTITINSPNDPIFNANNPKAEIHGRLRLTQLRLDSSKMILHNPYTWAIFAKPEDANGASELLVEIKPNTMPKFLDTKKIRRTFSISAYDLNSNLINDGVDMVFNFGWHHMPGSEDDESENLVLSNLTLQRWDDVSQVWFNVPETGIPLEKENGWASNWANLTTLGSFAIGPRGGEIVFNAKVFLEGPYRYGSMANDLRATDNLPNTPPDMYPYNLDPNREMYATTELPDSVVDWVLVEFRSSLSSDERYYRTYLVRADGRIVDQYGNTDIMLNSLSSLDSNRIDSGNYFIAIKHRNHLSIITNKFHPIIPGSKKIFDFTTSQFIHGGEEALKHIGFKPDNSKLFGMIAGDVNQDGIVNDEDFDTHLLVTFENIESNDFDGYDLLDTDLNSTITTKDYNTSFNNRDRKTFISTQTNPE